MNQSIRRSASRLTLGAWLLSAICSLHAAVPRPADVPILDPEGKIHPALRSSQGDLPICIRLVGPSLSELAGPDAHHAAPAAVAARIANGPTLVDQDQDAVVTELDRVGARSVIRLTKALNAVLATVDASTLPHLALLGQVRAINPIVHYQTHLTDVVPSVGASALAPQGLDGSGVRVAVLDSGIDYTHFNLGGPGTVAAFTAAYGLSAADPRHASRDGLFPTAKVVDGHDFVGESWPNGPLAPDEDPIDRRGHGTHVADILAGRSVDGQHRGIAPGATLYAYKVCSSITTDCNGIAILQGLEAALDPDNDGNLDDAVDVVNLSFGADYGLFQDDAAAAVQNLTQFGVVVVCSAGNAGNKPYVVSSPAIAPGAIAVAETRAPGARAYTVAIQGPGVPAGTESLRNTAALDWAPVDTAVEGPVRLGGLGCAPYPAGTDFTGQIVLVDRGSCDVSLKVDRAAKLGALAVLIANNVVGDPTSFTFAGASDASPFLPVPALVITREDGLELKNGIALGGVIASLDPALNIPLGGSLAPSSSRGPSYSINAIKPDIAAPGGALSAVAGSGTGEAAFAGTSAAAPVVAGAAALLLQQDPAALPREIKARLMNAAEPSLPLHPIRDPGVLAAVTQVGAGEVRVDRAASLRSRAYEAETGAASLSFGYWAPRTKDDVVHLRRKVILQNTGNQRRRYTLSAALREPADVALDALNIRVRPESLSVPAGQTREFNVVLDLDPARLLPWELNSGPRGGDGAGLSRFEFDGVVAIDSDGERLTLPWQVLPHQAADNRIVENQLVVRRKKDFFRVRNPNGAMPGVSEFFALTGTNDVQYPVPPPLGAEKATPDLAAVGVRYDPGSDTLQFAVATHDQRSHANYPAEFDVVLDVNGDSLPEFVLYTTEQGGLGVTGQNVTTLARWPSFTLVGTYFFTDADLNASTMVLSVPLIALGIDPSTPIGFIVAAYDNYFTGGLSDVINENGGLMRITPDRLRFTVATPSITVPVDATVEVPVTADPAADALSPAQKGILALHRDARPGRWWEALPVSVKAATP